MPIQYYPIKEAAKILGMTKKELLNKGVNAEIAFMLPFRVLDGKVRYLCQVDLLDICDDYRGKKSTDLVWVAFSPESARSNGQIEKTERKRIDGKWVTRTYFSEDPDAEIELLLDDPNFRGIKIKHLSVTQDEIDRYLQENKVAHKNTEAKQSKANDAERLQSKLADFQKLENLRFDEIKICLDPDNLMLRVSARDIKDRRVRFHELGLTQKNGITPNSAGNAFFALARQVFNQERKGQKRAIVALSKALRTAFDTNDTPLRKYKPVFKLTVPKDIEAKQKANLRTTTYNDDIKPSDGGDLIDTE